MGSARSAAQAFSPLDDELELLPGQLTPWLHENLVRLGAWMPFPRAAQMLKAFTRVEVTEPTARRLTETAGAAYVALQTEQVDQLEHTAPAAPAGPAKQLLSADGAMVPLVGGKWAEVRTVVIGEVQEPVLEKGDWVVHTQQLSYFSRLADAETFTRLALVETQRRGVENAQQVGAVVDGADWLQGFVDHHRPDAWRILDFPHAAGYVSQIGQAHFGADSPELAAWLQSHLHRLKHEGPEPLLSALRPLVAAHPHAAALELPQALSYLEKRVAQLQYPTFQALGWPIASGAMESGNKLVVEARLKGAGMHWAPEQVNPILALRNIVCSDRWDEAWPQIATALRDHVAARRATRRAQRRVRTMPPPLRLPFRAPPPEPKQTPETPETPAAARPRYKPGPNHPWRRPWHEERRFPKS